MLLSAVSVLVVAQSISEIPEGLMNNPVYFQITTNKMQLFLIYLFLQMLYMFQAVPPPIMSTQLYIQLQVLSTYSVAIIDEMERSSISSMIAASSSIG